MDIAPEVVQQGKKSESSSSKKQVMGEGAENPSNANPEVADTDRTSTSPNENAGVQIAPLQRKQNKATKDVTQWEKEEKRPCAPTQMQSPLCL